MNGTPARHLSVWWVSNFHFEGVFQIPCLTLIGWCIIKNSIQMYRPEKNKMLVFRHCQRRSIFQALSATGITVWELATSYLAHLQAHTVPPGPGQRLISAGSLTGRLARNRPAQPASHSQWVTLAVFKFSDQVASSWQATSSWKAVTSKRRRAAVVVISTELEPGPASGPGPARARKASLARSPAQLASELRRCPTIQFGCDRGLLPQSPSWWRCQWAAPAAAH